MKLSSEQIEKLRSVAVGFAKTLEIECDTNENACIIIAILIAGFARSADVPTEVVLELIIEKTQQIEENNP